MTVKKHIKTVSVNRPPVPDLIAEFADELPPDHHAFNRVSMWDEPIAWIQNNKRGVWVRLNCKPNSSSSTAQQLKKKFHSLNLQAVTRRKQLWVMIPSNPTTRKVK